MDVSLIIATWNRRDSVVNVVQQIDRSKIDGFQGEIIVVDNGSTDGTYEAVKGISTSKVHLVVLSQPERGKNRALNRALEVAQGKLLVFTDDDIVPSRDWISSLWDAAQRWPDDAVFGGKIIPRFPVGTPDWLMSREFKFAGAAFGDYSPLAEEGPVGVPPFGANLAIRRQVFENFSYCEAIGPAGTSYAMGSETELLERLQANGYRFIFVPSAEVEHLISAQQVNEGWLYRRAFRSGRGGMRLGSENCKKWLGVPRYCYRRLGSALMRFLLTRLARDSTRVAAGIAFWRQIGAFYEARLIAKEEAGARCR